MDSNPAIAMSEKCVILFTMHNFDLNVTNNCYELVIQFLDAKALLHITLLPLLADSRGFVDL
jgi:hypothetical protein